MNGGLSACSAPRWSAAAGVCSPGGCQPPSASPALPAGSPASGSVAGYGATRCLDLGGPRRGALGVHRSGGRIADRLGIDGQRLAAESFALVRLVVVFLHHSGGSSSNNLTQIAVAIRLATIVVAAPTPASRPLHMSRLVMSLPNVGRI
jgi:hypothetical protein